MLNAVLDSNINNIKKKYPNFAHFCPILYVNFNSRNSLLLVNEQRRVGGQGTSTKPELSQMPCGPSKNCSTCIKLLGLAFINTSYYLFQHVFHAAALNKVSQMAEDLAEIYDDMRAFNLDQYFICRGVFVCPEYRGLGIAQELLRIRLVTSSTYTCLCPSS